MLYPGFENLRFMFLLFLLSELLREYKLHIKMKNTKRFCFYFLVNCLNLLYWIALINDMIIAICFQLLSGFLNDYVCYDHLMKPRNTPVLFLRPTYFWKNLNKTASKTRNRRIFYKNRRIYLKKFSQRTSFFSVMIKMNHFLSYMSYMRLLEYDYVLITY